MPHTNTLKHRARLLRYTAILAAAALIAVGARLLYRTAATIQVGSDQRIMVTPQMVTDVRRVARWEFLSIVDEEVVDTIRHNHVLADDRLTSIYYGTISMGIDLYRAREDWVRNTGDTLTVTLPQPSILDDNFIDDARTVVFFEAGAWPNSARADMLRTAQSRMRRRAMTPANIDKVKAAATRRFTTLFTALGAKAVTVTYE